MCVCVCACVSVIAGARLRGVLAQTCLTVLLRPVAHISRVGQNRICTPYMTAYLMIFLPKIPYIHRIYMVLANPTHESQHSSTEYIHC